MGTAGRRRFVPRPIGAAQVVRVVGAIPGRRPDIGFGPHRDERFEPPVARRRGYALSADGTPIAYEIHGRQHAPTVVLSHGWACSTRIWAAVIRELAGELRVVAYDQRGHGRSGTADRSQYGTDKLADDLTAVLEATVVNGERAVLVGHSMGGMTMLAAADRPAVRMRTAAVLLASTGSDHLLALSEVLPAAVHNRRIRDTVHHALLVSAMPLRPLGPIGRAALRYAVLSPQADRAQTAVTARLVHACGRRQRAAWGRVLARLDLHAAVPNLAAPTAVLVGTADKLTPTLHAQRLAAELPHCLGLIELAGLGHMTVVEDPVAVAAAIRGLVSDTMAQRRPPAGQHGMA